MIERDTYCIDVITQTSAVKQALSNIEDVLMENHLGHCLVSQIKKGQTLTITLPEMTRFLLSLDRAVDTVFEAVKSSGRGLTFVPKVASAKITDVADVLMGENKGLFWRIPDSA